MLPYSLELYTKTTDAWEAMLKACGEATQSIDVEQYIFQEDEIGNRFIELFKQKVAQGVKIRLLIDMAGSYPFYLSSHVDELRKLGIEIQFFNAIKPWRIYAPASWFFRNHKKTLTIDKKVSFTGGTGIGFHMATWRDTNMRMEGPVVTEIIDSFNEMWEQAGIKRVISRFKRYRKNKQRDDFVTNAPFFHKRFLYHAHIAAMMSARKNIFLTTPYFIPDNRFRRVLRHAVRRGVDVKIIVPQTIDVPVLKSASHSLFTELLKNGVRIYAYQPTMLHAKTAIVDDHWATLGSFNLDHRSFLYNFEANVVSYDPGLAGRLSEHFKQDLKESKEVTYKGWKKRSGIEKFWEFLAGLIREFL